MTSLPDPGDINIKPDQTNTDPSCSETTREHSDQLPLLSVTNLVKSFGTVRAVDNISFAIPRGTCFGLLGPNGAGKTTTIELLEGILPPSSGDIRFKGAPPDNEFYQRIGIQFQQTALQDFLNVKETLRLFASLYKHARPVEEMIQLCSLGELCERDTRKLSGGQRQRLLLALALINDPELLFLDEPTTGLDPHARRQFWDLIERIKAEGKTILLTTHYMDEAQYLCDHLVIMDKGRIIETGSPEALLRKHYSGVIIRLPARAVQHCRALPKHQRLSDDSIEFHSDRVDATLQDLIGAEANLDDLQIRSPNLDDLFLKLTGHQLTG